MTNYDVILFKDGDFSLNVNVSPKEETVWLTKDQIALLFDRNRTVISKHINNIYKEGELIEKNSCAKNARQVGGQIHHTAYYNLDVIISVGYRVKSKRGVLFRRWANNILKQYLLKGYVVDVDRVTISKESFIQLENDVQHIKQEIVEIKQKTFIEPVKERLFFDGQYFDAHEFVCSLIESANISIIIIDPYFDISGLSLLSKSNINIEIIVLTSNKSKLLNEDVEKFKQQYRPINLIRDDSIHDRFIIIDKTICYVIGTSLNHLGKRTFAVNLIENKEIINVLINNIKL